VTAYIHRIRIDEFRTIKGLDIDLRPRPGDKQPFRHLVLTGPNGSGKSSALLRVAKSIHADSDPHLTWSPTTSQTAKMAVYVQANRAVRFNPVSGPAKLALHSETLQQGSAATFLQYLVNRKTEQAFAVIDKRLEKESELTQWFERLQDSMRWLYEDLRLTLEFDSKAFEFNIRRGDGSTHTLKEMADGHAAFVTIFAEIVLACEATGKTAGIVILDEIENHLHLRLQEQALPFLTNLFPNFQFITATHSPAVISSIPDAIVYDMARRVATPSEEFIGRPFGALMTAHFRLPSEFDIDSTTRLEALRSRAAAAPDPLRDTECQALADVLTRRGDTLAYEVWRILHEPKLPGGSS